MRKKMTGKCQLDVEDIHFRMSGENHQGSLVTP
jgi:hypothetical protein